MIMDLSMRSVAGAMDVKGKVDRRIFINVSASWVRTVYGRACDALLLLSAHSNRVMRAQLDFLSGFAALLSTRR